MREILRCRDIANLFGFVACRGWSRAAIAAATGLSESRVREVRQGRQQITSYEVLERIADGFGIARGLMGLAYTDVEAPATLLDRKVRRNPGSGVSGDWLGTLCGGREVRHPVDGKTMVLVPEGVCRSGHGNQLIWLPSFYMDAVPVTNDDYARFVAATGHRTPAHWADGHCPDVLLDHPVVNVTHRDACSYASWTRKLLPTVEEWEKAARGDKGDIYPWGNQPTHAKCNVRETGVGGTTPVGLYRSGVSAYGIYDASGNVWEWCRTETSPGRFVLKGGAFTSPFAAAACAATNDASEEMMDDDTGFRCVVPYEEMEAILSGASDRRSGAK